VDEFSQFFSDKVNTVGSNTIGTPDAHFSQAHIGASLAFYESVNVDDVVSAILQLPDKSLAADALPVSVLKLVTDETVLLLTELFNHSMSAGQFLSIFKEALITPAVKKLVVTDVQSYRPTSNLSVVSKLLERFVAQQLHEYLQVRWNLLPPLQSGFYGNSCSMCPV